MRLIPIDAAGARSPASASLTDEEFGKYVGMLKGWFLGEDGGVDEQEHPFDVPQRIAGSLSELGRLLGMLPDPAVRAGKSESSIYWTRIPDVAELQRLSRLIR